MLNYISVILQKSTPPDAQVQITSGAGIVYSLLLVAICSVLYVDFDYFGKYNDLKFGLSFFPKLSRRVLLLLLKVKSMVIMEISPAAQAVPAVILDRLQAVINYSFPSLFSRFGQFCLCSFILNILISLQMIF